jgi:diguanylate cyclase (GGDEF)-like protein
MERVLIVEDDAFFREIFSDLLREEGYQVDTATSGNEALKMLAGSSYELVVTDMVLQDISGLDILARAKQMDPDLEVIVVTGYSDTESAIYALKNGARDYLIKPISHDEFKHVVRLSMEQRRLLNENQELKDKIRLFQTCQTIANCIDLERILSLVLESAIKETGAAKGFAFLRDATRELFLMEAKGVTAEVAEKINEQLKLSFNWEEEPFSEPFTIKIGTAAESTELLLLPLSHDSTLQGVVVLFDKADNDFHSIINHGNIRFLVEQSALALNNAGRFSVAKELLNIDELTGLYNYRYLGIALDREMRRAERYGLSMSVIFLDVDLLKVVNDTYGHLVGSQVLKEVAAVIKKSVREVDIVIRYGGDEYTIILIETNRQGASIVAERIRRTIANSTFFLDGEHKVNLTASLGFACYPEDTTSKLELLKMADQAMYHGKQSGKNIASHISAIISTAEKA